CLPARRHSTIHAAHGLSGTPKVLPGSISGPPTSRDREPLASTATRTGDGQLLIAEPITDPSRWQRRALGRGGTRQLTKIGTIALSISGVRKWSGTRTP